MSTDWVSDAETALAYLEKARLKAPSWKENYVADKELYLAEKCIRWAIESERMRSDTAKLCNSPEAARPPGEEGSESR